MEPLPPHLAAVNDRRQLLCPPRVQRLAPGRYRLVQEDGTGRVRRWSVEEFATVRLANEALQSRRFAWAAPEQLPLSVLLAPPEPASDADGLRALAAAG